MRLTKFGHACARLDKDGSSLVIDPGIFSEAEALDGVSHVLVTHEHPDHVDVEKLGSRPGLTIYTHSTLAAQLEGFNVVTVGPGDTFTAAGFTVQTVGGMHAEVFDGLPGCANVGFVADGVYHPGDSYFVPDAEVHTLLVPASGPWTKFGEALGFTRAIKPARAFPIHETLFNERGLDYFGQWMRGTDDTSYTYLAPGESIHVG